VKEVTVALERSNPDGIHTPGAYSHIVRTTGSSLALISGQVGLRADGTLAGNDLESQARQVFANLGTALESLGATPANVAKITAFIVNWSPELRPALAAGRGDFFGDELPASTLLGVQALAQPELLIEVEAIVALE